MENRIRHIEIQDRSLDPLSGEVRISVMPEYRNATTEVRGRLMGPHCLYSSTIEVAYPLRPPEARPVAQNPQSVLAPPVPMVVRAVIPEASLWEPQSPFLYRGPVELWQDGRLCERVVIQHGLRSLQRDERGLLVNGRPLTLCGRRTADCSDEEAMLWREAGYNLLIAPVAASSLAVWEQADRFGFLVLGQLEGGSDEAQLIEMLRSHASCLGWLSAEYRALSMEEAVDRYLHRGNREP